MELNVKKTKELRISFIYEGPSLEQLIVNNGQVKNRKLVQTFGHHHYIESISWDQHDTCILL